MYKEEALFKDFKDKGKRIRITRGEGGWRRWSSSRSGRVVNL